jgi:hypothetical protein
VFRAKVAQRAPDARVVILSPGESFEA